jgi:hypothetical protein
MNADGSNPRFLADGSDPSWLPSGAGIIYSPPTEVAPAVFRIINKDGSGSRDFRPWLQGATASFTGFRVVSGSSG